MQHDYETITTLWNTLLEAHFEEFVKEANQSEYKSLFPPQLFAGWEKIAREESVENLSTLCQKQYQALGCRPVFDSLHHNFQKAFQVETEPRNLIINEDRIGFRSLLGENIQGVFNLPQASDTVVFSFRASMTEYCGDNLYLVLANDQTAQTYSTRFGFGRVSLYPSDAIMAINNSVERVFTVIASQQKISVYIDGCMVLSKKIDPQGGWKRVSLELMGKQDSDLEVWLKSFQIWTSQTSIPSLFDNELDFVNAVLSAQIASKDAQSVFKFSNAFDFHHFNQEMKNQIRNLLSQEIEMEHGFRDWLLEALLKFLPQSEANAWIEKHRHHFPKPILTVKDLTIEFYHKPNEQFSVARILGLKKVSKFRVLDHINFNVYPGDVVGIIGSNGSGKSTLLKAICGLVPIKQGDIKVYAPHLLLSMGLGARLELTGRENIYLSGYFLGMHKVEIDGMIDEIIQFSELEEAIDKPFKYYSDGMKSRLLFSVATSVSPDILILDELLGAGDVKFQTKAAKRMDELIERSKVVMVVTHGMQFIEQKCNKVLVLSKGKQIYFGAPDQAVSRYFSALQISSTKSLVDVHANSNQFMVANQSLSGVAGQTTF